MTMSAIAWRPRQGDTGVTCGFTLGDGTSHRVTFYDVGRLSQTLDDECASGRPFFTEPGLIVVPQVTRANMETAARALAAQGFFAE